MKEKPSMEISFSAQTSARNYVVNVEKEKIAIVNRSPNCPEHFYSVCFKRSDWWLVQHLVLTALNKIGEKMDDLEGNECGVVDFPTMDINRYAYAMCRRYGRFPHKKISVNTILGAVELRFET